MQPLAQIRNLEKTPERVFKGFVCIERFFMSDHHHHWQTIHSHHLGWDNTLPPAHRITPGTTLEFEILDAGGGQFNRKSGLQDLISLDFGNDNPVTRPPAHHQVLHLQ